MHPAFREGFTKEAAVLGNAIRGAGRAVGFAQTIPGQMATALRGGGNSVAQTFRAGRQAGTQAALRQNPAYRQALQQKKVKALPQPAPTPQPAPALQQPAPAPQPAQAAGPARARRVRRTQQAPAPQPKQTKAEMQAGVQAQRDARRQQAYAQEGAQTSGPARAQRVARVRRQQTPAAQPAPASAPTQAAGAEGKPGWGWWPGENPRPGDVIGAGLAGAGLSHLLLD